ncbi:MAG: Clp protease ClpP [Tissierellia bacterium]|nr:Clp protease ClpP [Tissierellia bacterium]
MTIKINGVIVGDDEKWIYDYFEMSAFCPKDLYKHLVPREDVDIEINSAGGSVFPASEIYTALINHKGNVNITITGLAASAASVIAMAGTHVVISPTAQIMIHNVSAYTTGDYREMEHTAKLLKESNDTIANAYMLKTGLDKKELLELMDAETWLGPDKCIELGFADEILKRETSQDNLQLVASYKSSIIPKAVVDKLNKEKAQEQLNLLKLKEM